MAMKTILITGAGRGLGHAAAIELARRGHHMVLTARTADGATAAAEAVRRAVPGSTVSGRAADLSSLASVRALAQGLVADGLLLDVLFHVAGVMQQSQTRRVTVDGFEETLAVNALAPLLLTHLTWCALRPGGEARVVCVSSRMHLPDSRGEPVRFDFDDPQLERGYQPDRAYKNSKLALMWFSHELARRAAGLGVTVNSVCPGFVPATAAASTTGFQRFFLRQVLSRMPFATSVEAAVDSLVFMAVDPSLNGVTGGFFGEKRPLEPSRESRDLEKAARFWRYAATCVGITDDWPLPSV